MSTFTFNTIIHVSNNTSIRARSLFSLLIESIFTERYCHFYFFFYPDYAQAHLFQLCTVTGLSCSSWCFVPLVLFPIPCWALLVYRHTCPFSFKTLMSDRSYHVGWWLNGAIPLWLSFMINIALSCIGQSGWSC